VKRGPLFDNVKSVYRYRKTMKTRFSSLMLAVSALALSASLVPVPAAAAEDPPCEKREACLPVVNDAEFGAPFQLLVLKREYIDIDVPLVAPDGVVLTGVWHQALTCAAGPMSTMRAKLQVSSVTPSEHNAEQETLRFHGVARSEAYPEDGSDENNTFAKFSPSVDLEIVIANPALVGKFKPGDTFYVDFTPVPA
jgi:hypothetical protein